MVDVIFSDDSHLVLFRLIRGEYEEVPIYEVPIYMDDHRVFDHNFIIHDVDHFQG